MERVTGIEPAFSAWEADVLPLNYTRAGDVIVAWGVPAVAVQAPDIELGDDDLVAAVAARGASQHLTPDVCAALSTMP